MLGSLRPGSAAILHMSEPNRMPMREDKGTFSFAFDLALTGLNLA